MITDMTAGSTKKILIQFSLPMLLSSVFQQLYNMADSIIAGHFAGRNALAAVGASYPVTMIFMAVATGLSIGCTVIISRHFGAGEYADTKTAIFTSLFSSAVVGLFFTVAGLLACRPIMLLLQTDPLILDDAVLYLQIYLLGMFFLFLYNSTNGIFTALGDSRTPLLFLIVSSVGNIILDYVFVALFAMGVSGVAWATFLCQGICSVLAFLCLLKRLSSLRTERSYSKFSGTMLRSISTVAIPSILQQSFISVGNLFIQGLVNSFGVDATAGYSAAVKLNTFAVTTFTTMGNSVSCFTAQNLGAKKVKRVREGYRTGLLIIGLTAIPFILTYVFLAPQMVSLFLDPKDSENVQALQIGTNFLRIVAPFYWVVAAKLVADGVLRGAEAMRSFMVATFTDLILRVLLSFVLYQPAGINGIWFSWPIGWIIASVLSYLFYAKGTWRQKYAPD